VAIITFLVEDGSGKPGATSYNEIAVIDQYFLTMVNAGWPQPPEEGDDPDTAKKQAAAIMASFYLDGTYGGYIGGKRKVENQGLIWPRVGAYFLEGLAIDSGSVPNCWLRAHCEVTLLAFSGTKLTASIDAGPLLRRKKIDVLEKEWFEGSYGTAPVFGDVDLLLAPLIGEREADGSIQIWGIDRA
jgi:hypothetical protein